MDGNTFPNLSQLAKMIQQWICKVSYESRCFFNMEPENDGFQKESPFPEANFQVPCYAELICHGKQRGPRAAQVCINYTQDLFNQIGFSHFLSYT